MLASALDYLDVHEMSVRNGSVPFQLLLKMKEREESDLREREHQEFIRKVLEKARRRAPLAVLEVNLGDNLPKLNLTLQEGQDIKEIGK